MSRQHYYVAIDLKTFYASAECTDRHLDPLCTNLVVADASRTEKTICLAVSPSLKALGISGRARLFEVIEAVRQENERRLRAAVSAGVAVNEGGRYRFSGSSFDSRELSQDPSLELTYLTAPPRMSRYMELSAQIYSIYLKYISGEDIHPYSIDEVFMDVTPYLDVSHMTARELVMTMIREVFYTTGITATCGIGTNLYLAKIAMDIVAKHMPPDDNGVRIAGLDEQSYRELLWDHTPITDFWRIGHGTAGRLARHNISTMGELARASVYDQEWFYDTFGIDAEILIDHAWGIEPCGMKEIKEYTPESSSICEGQVLSHPYTYEKARIIVREMADSLSLQLAEKCLVTDSITLDIGYDRENVDSGRYCGSVHTDHYGRAVPPPAHGTARLSGPTGLGSRIISAALEVFDRIADRSLSVRRITITANRTAVDEGIVQMDMFTDIEDEEREKKLQDAVLSIRHRYGKNAVLRGTSFQEGATMRERNGQIGGHKA